MTLQVGDLVKAKRNIPYNYYAGEAHTLIEKGTTGVIIAANSYRDGELYWFDVLFEKHLYLQGDVFDGVGQKKVVSTYNTDVELVRKQPIRSDEFMDSLGNIRRKVGPLGKEGPFGYFKNCPRCGGKMVRTQEYTQGYGSASSSHVSLECENCGWSTHVVYD